VGDFPISATRLSEALLARRCAAAFARGTALPAQWAAAPEIVPGVAWSDHRAFWQDGWPAVMPTDTAPYRDPHHHLPSDRTETLDLARLAQVVDGLEALAAELPG
jgi:hypothetical protein